MCRSFPGSGIRSRDGQGRKSRPSRPQSRCIVCHRPCRWRQLPPRRCRLGCPTACFPLLRHKRRSGHPPSPGKPDCPRWSAYRRSTVTRARRARLLFDAPDPRRADVRTGPTSGDGLKEKPRFAPNMPPAFPGATAFCLNRFFRRQIDRYVLRRNVDQAGHGIERHRLPVMRAVRTRDGVVGLFDRARPRSRSAVRWRRSPSPSSHRRSSSPR